MKISNKKRKFIWGSIVLFIYIVFGTMIPYLSTKKISDDYMTSFHINNFYNNTPSVDRAMILESNWSAWEERLRGLNIAKKEILLSTFDLRDGESTRDVLSIILAKAEEGVKVKILVDGSNATLRMLKKPIFKAVSSHPNIKIKLYNPINIFMPWKSQGRLHDKYLIVDDILYILGGRNTSDHFLGDYKDKNKSLDRELLIYNGLHENGNSRESSLFQLKKYFMEVWDLKENVTFFDSENHIKKSYVKDQYDFLKKRHDYLMESYPEFFTAYFYKYNTVTTNKVSVLANDVHIYGKEPKVFYSLIMLMKAAKFQIKLHSPYIILNEYMINEIEKVVDEVKDFKVLVNSVENGENFFASSDYLRNKKKIIETRVGLYEFDGGISYHGKSLTIDDDISIVGTYNLDLRSTYVNTELMVVINSKELTKILQDNMNYFEVNSRRVIDEKMYEVPEHLIITKIHPVKRLLFWIAGLFMIPFRILL